MRLLKDRLTYRRRSPLPWVSIRIALLAGSLAAIVITAALLSCGGRKEGRTGVIMRVRTGQHPEATRKPTDEERQEIMTEIEVVKNYWALPYISEYDLFSSSFKQILEDAHGVANADDYNRVMSTNEREWTKETYEEAELIDSSHGQVTALAYWKETGYTGVQTVIFDMIKEEGEWKISSIFY